MNMVLGHYRVVVDKERQIDGGRDIAVVAVEIVLAGEEVKRRKEGEMAHAFGCNLPRLANGATGAGLANPAHDRNSAIHFRHHDGNGANLLLVGEEGKAAHGAVGQDAIYACIDQVTGKFSKGWFIDQV